MVWVWSVVIVLMAVYVIPLGLSYFFLWRDAHREREPRRFAGTQRHVPHGV